MRFRSMLTAGATAVLVVAVPVAAVAQDTTSDPSDTEGTFVPIGPGADEPAADPEPGQDELPHTGGGMAALGGLALTGVAALRARRR